MSLNRECLHIFCLEQAYQSRDEMGRMGHISVLATHENLRKKTEYNSKTTLYKQKHSIIKSVKSWVSIDIYV